MATVIRVKRSLGEEPIDSKIVLNCKRRKTESEDNSSTTSTILKFAGTVDSATNIQEHISKLTKKEAAEIVSRTKQHPDSLLQNRLDLNREKSQQNRFKVVNCTRALDSSNDCSAGESSSSTKEFTIVDVEKDKSFKSTVSNNTNNNTITNGVSTHLSSAASFSDLSDEAFVYDIYIADTTDSAAGHAIHPDDLNSLSILEYNDYLYSLPRLVNDGDSDKDADEEEDEDSNDENNWRNEYPDDDNESIGERQMRRAMESFAIENELSSDDDSNGFAYSVDAEGITFEDDLDFYDVNHYGEAYAKYKKRCLRELKETEESQDDDDDEEEEENSASFHSD